jgi:hypothetical protein
MGSASDEMVSARTCVDSGGRSMAIARPDLPDGEQRCEPAVPAAGKVTLSQSQMDAIQAIVDKANAAGMRLTTRDVISVLNSPAVGKTTNYDPIIDELRPNTATTILVEWPMITVMTDADESMLGEARHKTIGGRGVVGRLIDGAR